MELFGKIAAGAVAAAVLGCTVRVRQKELGTLVSLAACAVLCAAALGLWRTAADFLRRLSESAGLDPALTAPVYKVCAIGLLTQLCETFCREAGELTAGKLAELGGAAAAVCAALPLVEAVLKLTGRLLGG